MDPAALMATRRPRGGEARIAPAAARRDERSSGHDERLPLISRRMPGYVAGQEGGVPRLEVALGVLLGLALAASVAAGARLLAGPRRVLSPEGAAAQAAVHAVAATLPHLRRGLSPQTAAAAVPHLRHLVGAPAVALLDAERVLALDGAGADHHGAGDPAAGLLDARHPDRLHIESRLRCGHAGCPLRAAVVAPVTVADRHAGSLVAFYTSPGRVRPEEVRVVGEVASLVGAQVAIAEVEAQSERLAEAELRALRAQISPHFIYNALAAVASHIHARPDEARELLTDFAEFTRYAFRGRRPYVTLADELTYVQKYLRLEQARFGERLRVRLEVAPEVLHAVVPVLSVQPLVENAVRHGVEREGGTVAVEIVGIDRGPDVELRVCDDGPGFDDAPAALAGRGGGVGLVNVDGRLRHTFGAPYGLVVDSAPGRGTTVVMTVPKFRAGVRAA
jgi:two-component system LytT family sensor kinase